MKLKKVLLLALTSVVLSGCDFFEVGIFPSINDGSSSEVNQNTSSGNNGGNSENSQPSQDTTDDITDDDSIYEKDYYKSISFKEPNFTTRKITSIDDVTFDDLFNLGNRVTFTIDVKDDQLQLIQKDYETGHKSEIYRIAEKVEITLTNYGNTYTWTFDQVGIRQKGNTSRDDVFKDGKICNLNHFKLSFDETFDDPDMYGKSAINWTGKEDERVLRKDRDFLGMAGIDIKWNKNFDTTHIKEIYSSYIYDAAGLMANSIGLVEMNINQVDKNRNYDFGLCTIFEPVNKSFIKRELKKGPYLNMGTWNEEKAGVNGIPNVNYGDLYKASYGVGEGGYGNGADLSSDSSRGSRIGIGNISGSYIPVYERKTNDDVAYDNKPLKDLTSTITNGSYLSIEKIMDLEYFAISEACNYIIGNPDDLRNNNNNYQIYIRRTDGKAIIIPIDNDRCFGITKDYNPDGHGTTEIGVFSTKPAAKSNMNNLHKKTILSSSSNDSKAIYLAYVKALKVSTWTKAETFKAYYDMACNTYGNGACSTSFGVECNFNLNDRENWTFSNYMDRKLQNINLDQTISVPQNSSGNNNNNNSGNQETSQPENQGNYGNIYLVGNFCNWSTPNKNYPFEYLGEGNYQITFTANNVEDGTVKYKIYDGENYHSLDWTVEGNTLIMEVGSSAKIYDCHNGQQITIKINTISKLVEIVKGE